MPLPFASPYANFNCAPGFKQKLCDEFMVGGSYTTNNLEKCFVKNPKNEWNPIKSYVGNNFGGKKDNFATSTFNDKNKTYKITGLNSNNGTITECGSRFSVYSDCCGQANYKCPNF